MHLFDVLILLKIIVSEENLTTPNNRRKEKKIKHHLIPARMFFLTIRKLYLYILCIFLLL